MLQVSVGKKETCQVWENKSIMRLHLCMLHQQLIGEIKVGKTRTVHLGYICLKKFFRKTRGFATEVIIELTHLLLMFWEENDDLG